MQTVETKAKDARERGYWDSRDRTKLRQELERDSRGESLLISAIRDGWVRHVTSE